MDLITYGLLNKAKANLDSPAFTGTPTAPTPLTPDNSNKLATTEFVRSVIATLKGFYLGVTTTTLVDEVTTDPNVVINGETVTAQDGNWVIASGGEEFVYSGTVWQKFGDSNWISVIGNTYNSSLTYNTGDCVIYMDGLYECQEDDVTGDWDSSKWQATTIIDLITGGIPLENLSNVTITNPQAGNHLVFDGTKWKNSTIVSPALSELSDVELENITDGQALIYNDEIDKWENKDIQTGEVTKTASGNPVEFTDGADAPLVKCTTTIQGNQDLHGYDKPWVGGAGKNKLDVSNWVVIADPDTQTNVYLTLTPNTNYTVSANVPNQEVAGGGLIYAMNSSSSPSYVTNGVYSGRSRTVTTNEDGIVRITYINRGYITNWNDWQIQVELGSTATPYAPYSNICPITAYNQSTILVGGKNLLDESTVVDGQYLNDSGVPTYVANGAYYAQYIPVTSGTYTISFTKANDNLNFYVRIHGYNSSKVWQSLVYKTSSTIVAGGFYSYSFTVPAGISFVRFSFGDDISNVQIEKGTTATDYEPYVGTTHTATFSQSIYQGNADFVGGVANSTYGFADENSFTYVSSGTTAGGLHLAEYNSTGENKAKLNALSVCNMLEANNSRAWASTTPCIQISPETEGRMRVYGTFTTLAEFKTQYAGLQIFYELATPTTETITPTNLPLKSLFGYNHIESTTGEMEVEYITEGYQPIVDLPDNVVPNPEGEATDTLEKIKIENTIYDFDNFSGDYNDLTNKPTLGTASSKDVATSGNASSTQVVMGNDTRLTDRRGSTWGQINGTLANQTDLKGALDDIGNRIDGIIALPDGSTTADAELRDIRTGVHGATFNSAGDAVRANSEQLYNMKTGFDGVVYDSPAEMVTSCDQKLQGEIYDLKSDITYYFETGNQLFDKARATVNGYYNVSTKVFYPNSALFGFFIPLNATEKVTISIKGAYCAFTSTKDTSVNALNAYNVVANDLPYTLTAPNGTNYFFVAVTEANLGLIMVNKGESAKPYEEYIDYTKAHRAEYDNNIYDVKSIERNFYKSAQLFDYRAADVQAYYKTSSPYAKTTNSGLRGEYIRVRPNETYTIAGARNWSAFVTSTSDNNAIIGWGSVADEAKTVVAPYNANYLYVSCATENTNKIMVNVGNSALTYESFKHYSVLPEFDESKYDFMYVKDGKVLCNESTSSTTAYYAGIDAGATVTEIRSSFIWEAQGTGGVAAFIINPNGLTKVSDITDLSLHLTVSCKRLKLDILGNRYGQAYYQNLIDETYTEQDLDGVTVHKMIMSVNTATDTVTVTYDGTVYTGTFVGDATIPHLTDVIGRYAQFEHYGTGERKDLAMPMFTSFIVKTSEYVVCDLFNREDGILCTTPQGHPYVMINTGYINRVLLANW